jgi:hypothetical protein
LSYAKSNLESSRYWVSIIAFIAISVMSIIPYGHRLDDMFERLDNYLVDRKPLVDAKFFENWGEEVAIIELRHLEVIAYIGIPLIIFLNLIFYVGNSNSNPWDNNLSQFFGNISIEKYYRIISILNIY